MTSPQADRVSGTGLKIQSKIKQFELRHPVPITPANIGCFEKDCCHICDLTPLPTFDTFGKTDMSTIDITDKVVS
jgi:hypothetical protein